MQTQTQIDALARGMKATLERTNDRVKTVLVVEHESNVTAAEVLRVVKHAIVTSGLLKPGRGSIEIGETSGELEAALIASENHVERLQAEVERLRQERREQDERLDRQLVVAASGEAYVSIADAAKALGKCYATVYRSVKDGRIASIEKRINKHSTWEVLVSTYRPKPGKAKGK